MDHQFIQLAALFEEEDSRPRQTRRSPAASLSTWLRRIVMRRRGNYRRLLEDSLQYQWLEEEPSGQEEDESDLIFLGEAAKATSSHESPTSTALPGKELTLLDLPVPGDLPDPILPTIV
jgi:hypothetical protein